MVVRFSSKLALLFKADLESVTDVAPADGYEWHFKIQCNSCHEIDPSWITMNREDTYDLANSRGSANLVMKCKFCKRESSAQFEPTPPIKPYTADDSGRFTKMVVIDCRGLEPVEFEPRVSEGWRGDCSPYCADRIGVSYVKKRMKLVRFFTFWDDTFAIRYVAYPTSPPQSGWMAKGAESGTRFDDIDLSEGEWVEYDEKSAVPVSISNIEAKFQKA
ncbi:hypothetical protein BC938DRAFT_483229 [Jimgerdemannia flammicorona]|uniref:DUF866-domain-containing protein n=1 Tax=Jimgerdemannia flammicorona TaxID=994334 RepID=A0A433QCG9_9FUNG|nr:hypothetical protein BC938DRAFT_483229 [Jimgerdemannia flammicorona]